MLDNLRIEVSFQYTKNQVKEDETFNPNREGFLVRKCDSYSKQTLSNILQNQLTHKIKYKINYAISVSSILHSKSINELDRNKLRESKKNAVG